jgi:hypothetical protein
VGESPTTIFINIRFMYSLFASIRKERKKETDLKIEKIANVVKPIFEICLYFSSDSVSH